MHLSSLPSVEEEEVNSMSLAGVISLNKNSFFAWLPFVKTRTINGRKLIVEAISRRVEVSQVRRGAVEVKKGPIVQHLVYAGKVSQD